MTSTRFDPAKGALKGIDYVFSDELVLAVNTALAANRPLLVRGPPGSGKSSLGRGVAFVLGRRYYEFRFSSQTRLGCGFLLDFGPRSTGHSVPATASDSDERRRASALR
jgi:hypothetical protein